ncbi:MAG: YHS domain-containing (seleno)protein [Alphaproteobacteria bacterium]|nr:YHS domain-containing (seleno)protein [Alphaproteobacteria bacterium]
MHDIKIRKIYLALALLCVAMLGSIGLTTAAVAGEINATTLRGIAIEGTDPVAYFTEGKPVEGSRDFSYDWKGATWRFSSAENLEAFKADPEAYAPQYGGYCAWAVSQGYTAKIDPEAFRIEDGKLYLNYSKGVQERWMGDVSGNIAAADRNWPDIKKGL